MILLLGASGYIGEAFAKELRLRKMDFIPLARKQVDYTRFDLLLEFLKSKKPEFVINAAGYTGKPNVDACELDKAGTLLGNSLLPQTISHACAVAKIPWGHVSSGCIFSGAKIIENGKTRNEKDLTKPELRALVEKSPEKICGFVETDTPNFSFRDLPC
ncbi:MAG: sugar nucleotide-binding protein, partial [Limisphaerales bacterium]